MKLRLSICGLAEHRLTGVFREVGSNLENWGKSTADKYIGQPVEQGNVIKTALGTVAAVGSLILEAPDALVAGALDNKVDFDRSGLRTTRDLGMFTKNVLTLHWLRAATDGWRIATTDLPLDLVDTVGGFRSRMANTVNTAA